jgi:hypothetical protein
MPAYSPVDPVPPICTQVNAVKGSPTLQVVVSDPDVQAKTAVVVVHKLLLTKRFSSEWKKG